MKANNELDFFAGIITFLLGIIILFSSWYLNLLQYDIGLILIFFSFVYIMFKSRRSNDKQSTKFKKISTRGTLSLNVLFFLLYIVSILVLYFNLYYRPPLYFLLISIMSSIIAIEIMNFDEKVNTSSIIIKIIMLSFNIRYGIYYGFNSLIGNDLFVHVKWINQIMDIGFVTSESVDFSKYLDFPIFHILNVMVGLLTSLNPKDTIFFTVVFFLIVSTLFIFFIGKQIIGVKFGLLALLLANITDMFIVRGVTSITPGSIVFCLFLFMLFLIFKDNKKTEYNVIKVIIIISIVLTHQLSTFVALTVLIGFFFSSAIYNFFFNSNNHPNDNLIPLNSVLFFSIVLLFYWMQADTSVNGENSFFYFALNPLINALTSGDFFSIQSSSVYIDYYAQYSIISNALFHFGYLLLMGFAIVGGLNWLSPNTVNKNRFVIVITTIFLYFFIYGLPLTGMGNTQLATRWLGFAYLFLILLGSQGILYLSGIFTYYKKIVAISLLTLLLTFIMITTPYINGDSPIYCKDRWPRAALTDSEIHAATYVTTFYNSTIQTDASYKSTIFRELSYNHEVINIDQTDDKSLMQNMVLIRSAITREPVIMGWKGSELGVVKVVEPEFVLKFESSGHDLIYDNYGVKAYLDNQG